ncbi:LysR family transcriptional regulator [Gordonia neofelifaecis]|uniref:LysR family transcriptional regulator n=1 Tax=Gordonia neofelifaecis NRRL B-59395 TaxID=644548 RepID=F1YPS5_9ACTN|nr:LysR family transcriptional regulator [Gordonia neofelifaecis]EGD53295.1 LysR family transcriptional regulator [Gordonia neofelifaecis NRRL B-59395]
MIDVGALRALRAIADLGTMARAADELGFTPSAISQQIKRLEAQVGVRLVAPAGRRVVLTPAGTALVETAPEVLAALEKSVAAARSVDAGSPRGVVRIAAFSTGVRGIVAPALKAIRRRYPEIRVEVTELDPVPAVYAVESGNADLAMVHDADGVTVAVPPGLERSHLHTDVGDLAVPVGHPLADVGRPIRRSELGGCGWVTSPVGTVCHRWFERLFAESELQPDVVHSVDDFGTQMALVAAGDEVALIPRLARPRVPDGVVVRELHAAPRREVYTVWRQSAEADPALRAVLTELRGASASAVG